MINHTKKITLLLSVLFSFCLLSSCENDGEVPVLTAQIENIDLSTPYMQGDSLVIRFVASDNDQLESVSTRIDVGGVTEIDTRETNQSKLSARVAILLTSEESGEGLVTITAVDCAGQLTTQELVFAYEYRLGGQLGINMKLLYNGEPLQTFKDYFYPDGRTINFTRFTTYIADLALDENRLTEIDFHNFTSINSTIEGATGGLEWIISAVPIGDYDALSFGMGVPADLNAMSPGEFSSEHPLARAAEHWLSWGSYIFFKIEGSMDSNNDGNKDLPISLHIGADEAYRIVELPRDITITEGNTSYVDVEIDLYKILGGLEATYDIDDNPQIHSLSQIDAVVDLANNLQKAIN